MSITINGTTGIAGVDGSAATPSVQGADTNTGIFFPAADTVAIATGGTERMRVDSSGNVGIGTTSPLANLHVVNGTSTTLRYPTGDWAAKVFQQNDASTYGGLVVGNRWAADASTIFEAGSLYGGGGANWASYFKITGLGAIGLNGSNYGTSGQVLTSSGPSAVPSWASRGFASTTITNTSRASATNFQNTTNGTMLVTVVGQNNGASMSSGATTGTMFQVSRQNATYTAVSCMVPPGWYYSATYSVLNSWIEGQ
jgi:hypothetical protein